MRVYIFTYRWEDVVGEMVLLGVEGIYIVEDASGEYT